MCVQRSLVVMQGTSLPGVSLTRLSHPAFDCALAVAGRQRTAAAQSAGSHHCLTRCGMSDPPEQVDTGPGEHAPDPCVWPWSLKWTLRSCYVSVADGVKPSQLLDGTHLSDIERGPRRRQLSGGCGRCACARDHARHGRSR